MSETSLTYLTNANMDHTVQTIFTIQNVGMFAYLWANSCNESVLIVSRIALTDEAQVEFMAYNDIDVESHDMYPKRV